MRRRDEFERLALPHLDAVHSLAAWLVRSRHDADDIVQETYIRAYRAFDAFEGEAVKPWLLTIARNLSYTWLGRRRRARNVISFEEALSSRGADASQNPLHYPVDEPSAEAALIGRQEADRVGRGLADLSLPLRETIVLRDMEDMSYQEIAEVMGVPIGTVMSRLSRARAQLRTLIADLIETEDRDAM